MPLAVHRSSKMIPDFTLHRPESVDQAVALSQIHGPAASFMAGGVSLINVLKTGAPLGNVIHLGRLPSLRTITVEAGQLRIGAGVTLWQLQNAPELARLGPAVQQAISAIGNVRVRMKGTVGGNIMAREANYDVAPVMMALGAELDFAGAEGGVTSIPASSLGWPQTPSPGLLLGLRVPMTGAWFGYDRTLRPAISLAAGFAGGEARIGIACAYPQAFCSRIALPGRLDAQAAAAWAQDWAAGLPEPVTDAAASGRYRRRMAAVLLRRVLGAYAASIA